MPEVTTYACPVHGPFEVREPNAACPDEAPCPAEDVHWDRDANHIIERCGMTSPRIVGGYT